MDMQRIGGLIRRLRTEKGLTQLALAERLHVSDKAVSKWERGQGCPDISLLTALAEALGADVGQLLDGAAQPNDPTGGNMKRLNFYFCPTCHNLVTAMADANVSCCGRTLKPLQPKEADDAHRLSAETVEDELFLTSNHPMTKAHHIAFVALLTGDTLMLRKQYPEWGLQTRLPKLRGATLLWYCTEHGLFAQRLA